MTASSPSSFLLPYSEESLLRQLDKAIASQPAGSSRSMKQVRQLRHKLKLRRLQRHHGLPNLDWDKEVLKMMSKEPDEGKEDTQREQRPLDRYQDSKQCRVGSASPKESSDIIGVHLIQGLQQHQQAFRSPYTGRELRPFIRREFDLLPTRLRLHRELLSKTSTEETPPPTLYPVDFCYVRPWHIPAVNRLAREFFWPGIDMSESLQYPDFSCVALYRQMVVGFAFLIPDLSHTEAYISFIFTHPHWRRGGIAKFMLYHLIQTCSGRDITLHVSANNPAVMLYQNFGFKVEERVLNFYDKYLPTGSTMCKHALFLRLTR